MGKSIRSLLADGPDRSFLLAHKKRISRKDCSDQISERVNILRSNGYSPGDIVAAPFSPSIEAVIWILSILEAGLMLLPVNTRESVSTVEGQLKKLGAGQLPDSEFELQPGMKHYDSPPGMGSLLIRTSGTTADGKLVQLGWPSLLHGAGCAAEHLQFGPGSRWLLNLPLYHVGGLGPVWRALVSGGALVMPNSGELFSHVSMVATQLQRVVAGHDARLYEKCSRILVGGGPVSDSLLREAGNLGLSVTTSYGMTETGSLIIVDGVPTGSCEAQVSEDHEIQVRGPGLFAGYFDPESRKLILPLTGDGWFRTGDLGRWDDQGKLLITGRKDNQFISGGENIQPEEIESALLSLGGIRQAVVVGMPDVEFGMRPVAFIDGDGSGLGIRLERLLPKYKIPIKFLDLPKNNPTGLKPSRKQLSELAAQVG